MRLRLTKRWAKRPGPAADTTGGPWGRAGPSGAGQRWGEDAQEDNTTTWHANRASLRFVHRESRRTQLAGVHVENGQTVEPLDPRAAPVSMFHRFALRPTPMRAACPCTSALTPLTA